MNPFVSVIVAVYNDTARLARCLAALEKQTYSADRYEVVVVDNNSDVPVTSAIGPFPHARFEREPTPGHASACATGVRLARGEILAFTDSDCLPEPGWLAAGVACLCGTPGCGLVGGQVELFAADPQHPTAAELLSIATHMKHGHFIEQSHWALFVNMFVDRRVMEKAGPINPRVDNGDIEWSHRIHAAGYRLAFAPDAVVHHPARSRFLQHCHRTIRFALHWQQLRQIGGLGRGARFWIGQHLVWPLRDIYRCLLCHPKLTPLQKIQTTFLACLLIPLRIVASFLVGVGLISDPRKHYA